MKIIDFRFRPHTESILRGLAESPIFRDSLIAGGVDLEEFVGTAATVPDIAAELREAGITKACLIGRDAETTYDYKPNNEELKAFVKEAPSLFCAFAGLDPHKGMDCLCELEDRVKKDGFTGAATDPIYNKLPIDAPEFYPIYAKCCELNVPIVITTGPARFTREPWPPLRIPIRSTAWPISFPRSKSS